MKLQNDLILRAARGENIERYPVWLMRQAGRILPEYRAVRSKLSGFKELVETPEFAAEVTVQPVDLLGVKSQNSSDISGVFNPCISLNSYKSFITFENNGSVFF